jgi:tripartite-type tricarboxylate transporter receptor subunit TctC
MGRELGQSVVIENKPGAGGGIGMAQASKAQPDGYTILLSLSSFTVLPEADVVIGRAPMYTLNSLRPIARFTADPTVLAVRADAPWKTVKDFVDDARKRPGAINYGSSGSYGTMHVPMEILAQNAGIKLTHVPYTGAGPAVVALLGGQIDAISSGPATVLQQVKAGKLRVLAHWGNARLQTLPDVPSLKESGYDAEYAQWSGLFVPAGTPEAVVQKLRAAAPCRRRRPQGEGSDPECRQPDPVPGHAGLRALRAGRCPPHGRRGEEDRQGRIDQRPHRRLPCNAPRSCAGSPPAPVPRRCCSRCPLSPRATRRGR